MSACVDIAVLDELAGGGVPSPETRAHLEMCARCRGTFDEMRRNARLLNSMRGALDTPAFPSEPMLGVTGRRIGRFELRSVLGHGGMATVYHAVQDHPRRDVALKVMKHDLPAGPARRRFEYEVETLARLQHPGIAQLFEAGMVDIGFGPQPFFAMELVKGRRLTDFARDHQLRTRQRLELMIKVGEAVDYAHQKGIIHRDLKPSNILVVEEGTEARRHEGTKGKEQDAAGTSCLGASVPSCLSKILDFGVARSTDSDLQATTLRTHVGQLIGTVPYMSPEQAAGDPNEIDIRSDVYALGLVAFELLAERLPYEVKDTSIAEAVRIIREEEAAPLSSVNKVFRGDLQTIVAKALEKDKTRRYPSASAFVADLRHFLNDEPITARPPSATYQFRKFAKRNKALVTGVVGVFLTLLLGLAGTGSGFMRARAERNRAEARHAEAETLIDLLKNMLGSANPHEVKGTDYTVRQLLDDFARGLGAQLQGQPNVEATIHATIGNAYRGLGVREPAERHLQAALDLRRKTQGDEHPDVAQSLADLAWSFHDKPDLPAAEQAFRQSLEMRRRLFGNEHKDVAESLFGLSDVLRHRKAFKEAEPLAREALALQKKLLGSEHRDVAESLNNLGRVLSEMGDYHQAARFLREGLEMWRKAHPGDHPQIAAGLYELAVVLYRHADSAGSEAVIREALAMGRRVLGERHHNVGMMLRHLATLLRERGEYGEAETVVREGLGIQREVHGDRHPCTAADVNDLGAVLRDVGKLEESEPLLREALGVYSSLGDDKHDTVQVRSNLAGVLVLLGRFEEAESLARTASSQFRELYGDRHRATADALRILGQALVAQGAAGEAEPMLRESVEVFRGIPRAEPWRVARAESAWGHGLTAAGRFDEAEPLLTNGLRVLQETRGPGFVDTQLALRYLVSLYEAWGRPEKAAEYRALLAQSPS